jgi:IS5 family transposase
MLEHDVVTAFFNQVVEMAEQEGLLFGEHFSVDGTLLKAWAGHKSIRRKDGSDNDRPPDDWHGEKRSNKTHASTTDPDSRIYKKTRGTAAELAYLGHALSDNRHSLIVNVRTTHATGKAEREAAASMLGDIGEGKRVTLGADKGYDTRGFVTDCRSIRVTPHVAQNTKRTGGSAIDDRTTRHPGYDISMRKRKCIEQCFGWVKTIGGLRQLMFRGLERVDQRFTLAMAAYNLVRMRTLVA